EPGDPDGRPAARDLAVPAYRMGRLGVVRGLPAPARRRLQRHRGPRRVVQRHGVGGRCSWRAAVRPDRLGVGPPRRGRAAPAGRRRAVHQQHRRPHGRHRPRRAQRHRPARVPARLPRVVTADHRARRGRAVGDPRARRRGGAAV
ncbi:MAG: hypothetical protein AVDCRST_MAG54-1897, partial [uncultured Actinomycetospora sp.]